MESRYWSPVDSSPQRDDMVNMVPSRAVSVDFTQNSPIHPVGCAKFQPSVTSQYGSPVRRVIRKPFPTLGIKPLLLAFVVFSFLLANTFLVGGVFSVLAAAVSVVLILVALLSGLGPLSIFRGGLSAGFIGRKSAWLASVRNSVALLVIVASRLFDITDWTYLAGKRLFSTLHVEPFEIDWLQLYSNHRS